jgi:cytosine/adenosine deaminase-related metal-dependent hydrolase
MTKLYSARWVLPISSEAIQQGAILTNDDRIVAVGEQNDLSARFPDATSFDLGEAAIIPGLINTHSHLELTAMRGYLEAEESNFFAWLKKLTLTRLQLLTADDLFVSASWGVCEAARAGVTCVGDASDSATLSMKALRDVGLRGIVYQESFGPDPGLAEQNFEALQTKVAALRELETSLVSAGVSPHSPYTVSAPQLEMISKYALAENLPVMMHAAESQAEELLLREGRGQFAEGLRKRGIEWSTPGTSSIQYLAKHGILQTKPLLAHCLTVDEADLQTIKDNGAGIAHCPKSNAKLGHGRAPFEKFLRAGVSVGLGSDSVASNNICDLLEEARFAVLSARAGDISLQGKPSAKDALRAATEGGARAMRLADRIGVLEPERQADFTAISLSGVHQRPHYDPYSTLIFSSSARDVILTVVAGKEIYRDGRMTTIDEERLAARMNEVAKKLQATGV